MNMRRPIMSIAPPLSAKGKIQKLSSSDYSY